MAARERTKAMCLFSQPSERFRHLRVLKNTLGVRGPTFAVRNRRLSSTEKAPLLTGLPLRSIRHWRRFSFAPRKFSTVAIDMCDGDGKPCDARLSFQEAPPRGTRPSTGDAFGHLACGPSQAIPVNLPKVASDTFGKNLRRARRAVVCYDGCSRTLRGREKTISHSAHRSKTLQ